MATKQNIDMVNGPLFKNIWAFSLPLMAANLLQMLFNAADTIVVGRFAGQHALAAVGATGSLCFLLISLFNGLSMGTNVIVARYLGANEYSKVEDSVHTSMTLSIAGGIFIAILGNFISRPMLELMSTPADIIDMSVLYMKIYFCGMFFGVIYNFASAVLRAKGDTKRPLYFLIISGLTNAILNVIFVVFFKMSVAGVAIATVISQAIAATLGWVTLVRENDSTRLYTNKLHINVHICEDIVKIGVPAGIQGIVFSLSNVVIQSSINSLGSSTIVAGNSAAGNVENFVYTVSMALSQACITFTSQNVGANNKQKIKSIMHLTMVLSVVSTFILGFAAWYFGDFFLSLYTSDIAVIEAGKIRLFWVALMLFLNIILDIYVSSMRGMGYSSLPTILMIIGICGIRLAWLFIVFPMHRTLDVIYMCFPISWTITSIIQGILWYKCYKKTMQTN